MNDNRDDRGEHRRGARRPDREGGRRRWGASAERRPGNRPDGGARPGREDRPPRPREPELPEGVDAGLLDRSLRSELRTLSKENAEGVGGHLVMVGRALDAENFDLALEHAQTAARRAGRVAGVRETLGVVHYRRGEWTKALAEFRTARRLSGTDHLLPLIADTERGLGRPERALDLAASPEASRLARAEQIELAIVVAGARSDLGQHAAAVLHLRDIVSGGSGKEPWAARLRYAYAAALEADGQQELAQEWYHRAAEVDVAGETDAAELLGEDSGAWVVDLGDDDPVEEDTTPGTGESSQEPDGGPVDEEGSPR